MGLTILEIKNLKPKVASYRVTDSNGLCLEVTPAGGKLWRWRYRYNGKGQMAALGKWPDVSLAEARRLRDEAAALVKAGKHPTREKKVQKLRRAAADANTFEAVARAWLTVKSQGMNERYMKLILSRMDKHVFPHIGALPIAEITIPDIAQVIEKIGARGTIETAHRPARPPVARAAGHS